jgi:hypothetical protein
MAAKCGLVGVAEEFGEIEAYRYVGPIRFKFKIFNHFRGWLSITIFSP